MPAIAGNTPDLSGFAPWQLSGQWFAVGCTPAPVPIATSVPPGLPIGAVLGVVTVTGAYTLSDPAVTPPDGSQAPVAILASQASASLPAAPATVYPAGSFSTARLFYSSNWSLPALLAALNAAGIFGRSSQPSPFGT